MLTAILWHLIRPWKKDLSRRIFSAYNYSRLVNKPALDLDSWSNVGKLFPYVIADSSLKNARTAFSIKPCDASLASLGEYILPILPPLFASWIDFSLVLINDEVVLMGCTWRRTALGCWCICVYRIGTILDIGGVGCGWFSWWWWWFFDRGGSTSGWQYRSVLQVKMVRN